MQDRERRNYYAFPGPLTNPSSKVLFDSLSIVEYDAWPAPPSRRTITKPRTYLPSSLPRASRHYKNHTISTILGPVLLPSPPDRRSLPACSSGYRCTYTVLSKSANCFLCSAILAFNCRNLGHNNKSEHADTTTNINSSIIAS